ncbi:MAG: ribosome small subunit-dependent GTPase A [Brevibacterium sp.]|nr:ribosome small subunit-dependent GTPase A [Brevibacterium sp.]MDN5875892.1 ribosome small subunit-dependent GTPase A [Brevibacterium sp.]MDN5910553.1 ribosome small subunit-dependent GTPase A [Brevibacterium sp.]MDN6134361.1 ribosome small subunit-dependent GTPase A [Brevibacterium sp.]MDN6159048.1 ribosome small subunit-dependent GTPase A [Brevibacterium sp.]
MARIYRDEDYRPRPSKRGSRPRTKHRPNHDAAIGGLVTAVDRGRYRVVVADDSSTVRDFSGSDAATSDITAVRASHLRKDAVVPGDFVKLVGDTSGRKGSLARLVEISERRTLLRRSADDTDPTERVIVANVDIMGIVTATEDPEPSYGLIDRALTAAFDADITPLLIVTKTDLKSAAEITERFSATGVEIVSSGLRADGSLTDATVFDRLRGQVSVLVGHSGVGKSTLMNALVPRAERATGHVNDVTGRGRHTSSSAICLRLDGGGWLVDTPGVRSFGLAHVDRDTLISAFPELVDATAECPRGCTHQADAPGCRLDAWVSAGNAGPGGVSRLESLRKLLPTTG